MFKRKWSGLPADPQFSTDMKELGYFINKVDEVRSIENPNNYFKFFINRNERWNDRQRFGLNKACQKEVHTRLEGLGLTKVTLPLDATAPSEPHVSILVSADIKTKTRVVIIFGESVQDLGVLAHRVLSGAGGVNKGSMVSIVSALLKQRSSPADASAPGIILANLGELLWWPAGQRTLTRSAFDGVPMKSAAHVGNVMSAKHNTVPGNRTRKEHVAYVFEKVVPRLLDAKAGLDIIALGDGGDVVEEYLDWGPVWDRWGQRVNCLALVGGLRPAWDLKCEGFKAFLRDRARAYTGCDEPAGIVLSGADGNPNTVTFTDMGCPVLSSGEAQHTECQMIRGKDVVLEWLQEVALCDGGPGAYLNPKFEVVHCDPKPDGGGDPDWSQWQNASEEEEKGKEEGEVKKPGGEGDEKGKGKEVAKRDSHVIRVDTLSDSEDDEN